MRKTRSLHTSLRERAQGLTTAAREEPLTRVFAVTALSLWGITSLFLGASAAWQNIVQPAVTLMVGWLVLAIYDTQKRDGSLIPRKRSSEPSASPELDIEELDDRALVMLARRAKDEIAIRKTFSFRLDQGRS